MLKYIFVLTYALFCGICCCERSGELYNMKIVEDLYYGRISPYEMSISATPEYQKLKALADRNEGGVKGNTLRRAEGTVGKAHRVHD